MAVRSAADDHAGDVALLQLLTKVLRRGEGRQAAGLNPEQGLGVGFHLLNGRVIPKAQQRQGLDGRVVVDGDRAGELVR